MAVRDECVHCQIEAVLGLVSAKDQFIVQCQASVVNHGEEVCAIITVAVIRDVVGVHVDGVVDLGRLEGAVRQLDEEEELVEDGDLSTLNVTLDVTADVVEHRLNGVAIRVA